jgi:peptidoglycan/LPS O-acetylase OafA/YrhL
VFFVLSGFLITTLLLQEWEASGRIALWGFYRRRARRLLPALLLTLVLVGVLYAWEPSLNHGFSYPRQVAAALFYVGNWVIAVDGGSPLGLLNHLWSLAIEEQFYLLWPPLLVVVLARRWRGQHVALLLLAGSCASAVLRAFLWLSGSRHGLYFRTDTHADGLLLGCALGTFRRTGAAERARAVGRSAWVALAAAVALVLLASGPMNRGAFQFTIGYPLVALCAATLINHAVTDVASPLRAVLRSRPFVWVGARSYGMYLFFLPVMAVLTPERLQIGFWPTFAVRLVVIGLAAALSYRFLESRFLRKTHLSGAPSHVQSAEPTRARPAAVRR